MANRSGLPPKSPSQDPDPNEAAAGTERLGWRQRIAASPALQVTALLTGACTMAAIGFSFLTERAGLPLPGQAGVAGGPRTSAERSVRSVHAGLPTTTSMRLARDTRVSPGYGPPVDPDEARPSLLSRFFKRGGGPIRGAQERQWALQQAWERKLEEQIAAFEPVCAARVALSLPTRTLGRSERPRAAVLLQLDAETCPSPDFVRTVVDTVSHSIPGLSEEAVTVCDSRGRDLGRLLGPRGPHGRYLAFLDALETRARKKVEEHLWPVYGPDNIKITASAHIHHTGADPPLSAAAPTRTVTAVFVSGRGGAVSLRVGSSKDDRAAPCIHLAIQINAACLPGGRLYDEKRARTQEIARAALGYQQCGREAIQIIVQSFRADPKGQRAGPLVSRSAPETEETTSADSGPEATPSSPEREEDDPERPLLLARRSGGDRSGGGGPYVLPLAGVGVTAGLNGLWTGATLFLIALLVVVLRSFRHGIKASSLGSESGAEGGTVPLLPEGLGCDDVDEELSMIARVDPRRLEVLLSDVRIMRDVSTVLASGATDWWAPLRRLSGAVQKKLNAQTQFLGNVCPGEVRAARERLRGFLAGGGARREDA